MLNNLFIMNKVVVAIPVYKDKLTDFEIKSFKQGLNVLRKYDVEIFTFNELDLTIYRHLSSEVGKSFNVCFFDKKYFTSVVGYNRLMMEKSFYLKFVNYEYMLIYQLDAYVFKDELDYWCSLGYDYIGAPFFKLDNSIDEYTEDFIGVGNGGLSLRRISYCLSLLSRPVFLPFVTPCNLLKEACSIPMFFKCIIKVFGVRNNLCYFRSGRVNEDKVFSYLALKSCMKVNLPSPMIALKFSFEMNPSLLYRLNNDDLPFGCHAFEKYEYTSFWKRFIK